MDVWTIAWIIWFVIGGSIEALALLSRDPGSTLSEHFWVWFHVKDGRSTPYVWGLRALLLVSLVWLTGHLALGWPPS